MKKLRILFLATVFLMCWLGTALSEQNPYPKIEFQANQSYELYDLISLFSKYKTTKSSIISTEIYRDAPLSYLYNLNKSELEKPLIEVNNYFGGKLGIIFNGTGYTSQKQSWNDGSLQNSFVNVGYSSNAVFLCPLYWGFNSLEITLNVSPYYIKKNLGESGTENYLNLKNYFSKNNFLVEFLSSTGNISYGKTLWELTTPDNKTIYLISRQTCGASGRVGTTWFIMFYEKNDAVNAYKNLTPLEK